MSLAGRHRAPALVVPIPPVCPCPAHLLACRHVGLLAPCEPGQGSGPRPGVAWSAGGDRDLWEQGRSHGLWP